MHLRNIVTVGLLSLFLLGCGDKKVTMSEVEFVDTKAYVDGHPFSGEVWSDDTARWCLTAENGLLTSFTIYHDNGTPAYTMYSSADTLQAFDESGAPMSLDTFALRYKPLAEEFYALTDRIVGQNK